MPARKRNRRQPEHPDPVVRFGRALNEAKEREKATQRRLQAERDEAKRLAEIAAEHAARLAKANKRLERAIAGVKSARASGRGKPEADDEYRAAKAAVFELETGERPDWAPEPPTG
jgi:hypothetical protein